MTTFEFLNLFNDNIIIYFTIAIIVLFLIVLFINKIANSWFNPFKYIVFQFGIGISVACFLFVLGYVGKYSFSYIILSTVVFGLILWLRFPRRIGQSKIYLYNEEKCQTPFFLICYLIYILSTLLTYSLRGIPIFNEDSRLTTFTGAGGLGIIERFSTFFSIYCLFYIYNLLATKTISKFRFCILISPFVLFGILSGSRSSFLIFIFAYWGYNLFYRDKEIQLSAYKQLLIPILGITLFTFALEHATNLSSAVIPFFTRILACGDLYWYSLPYDIWQDVSVKHPFYDVTVGLLAPMRLVSESSADMPIGFQLTRLVYKGFDQTTGPVELFPISTLVYFGYGIGLLFTIFQSLLVSKLCFMFFRKSQSLILSSFLYFCFWRSLYFLGSFRDGMGQLFNIMLCFFLLIFIVNLIGGKFFIRK